MSDLKLNVASNVVAHFDEKTAAVIRSGELFMVGLVNGLV